MKNIIKLFEKVTFTLKLPTLSNPFKRMAHFLKNSRVATPLTKPIYRPTLYLQNPLLQVTYNTIEKIRAVPYEREKIFFDDGGHVSLDWFVPQAQQSGSKTLTDRTPICFVMHGLTGGSECNYIKVLLEEADMNGFRGVCLNGRGISNEMTSPIPFTWIGFEDLQAALKIIQSRYPEADIYMIGTSFGSNYLTRYLLRHEEPRIKGFVGLGTPFDVPTVMLEMSPICQKFFVKRYVNEAICKHQKMTHWEKEGLIELSKISKAKSLSEFYLEMLPLTGLRSLDELFKVYSIGQEIIHLKIPSLFINSRDDPIVTTKGIPKKEMESNPNIRYIETSSGGHLCWYEGIVPKRWYPKPTFSFLRSLVKN